MQNTIVDQYHGDPLYAQLHVLSRERPLVREMLKTASFEKVAVDSLPSTAFAWEDERRFPIHTKEDAVASILYRSKCASVPEHVDAKLAKATEIYGIEDHVFATKIAHVGKPEVEYALPVFRQSMQKTAVAARLGEKVLEKALMSGAIDKPIVQGGLNALQRVGGGLGAKSTEQAVGRGLMAAGGAGALGTAGAGAAGYSALSGDDPEEQVRTAAFEIDHERSRLPLGNEGQIKVAEYVLKRDYQMLPLEKRADAFSRLAMAARAKDIDLEPLTMKMAGMTICSTQVLRDWLGARASATEKLARTALYNPFSSSGPGFSEVAAFNSNPANWFNDKLSPTTLQNAAQASGQQLQPQQQPQKVAFNAGATYIDHGQGKYVPIMGVTEGGYNLGAPVGALPEGKRSIGLPKYQQAAKSLAAAQQAQKVAAAFDKLAHDLQKSPPYIQDRQSLVKLAAAIDTLDRLAGLEQHYDRKLPDPLQTVFNTEKTAMEMVDVAGMQVPVETLMQLPPQIWEQVDMPELAEVAQAGDPALFKQVFDTMPLDIKVVLQAQLG
jgi:hypothetical protein